MKYPYFPAMLLAGLLILALGCHTHSHDHPHDAGGHSHEPTGPEPLSFTVWTGLSELFVEFPPLVVGMESRFAAHFTEMENFRSINVGQAMVCLFEDMKEIAVDTASQPSSPGIFRLGLTPAKAGTFDLAFVVSTPYFKDTIFIKNISVYPDEEAAMADNPPQSEGDEISFLKEQAWKVDFAIEQVRREDIHEVIRTSGEFLPVKGEETMLSTNTSGIVFFKSKNLMEGREVQAGEVLFTVSSKGLTEENLEEKFNVAKAKLEKVKADHERSKSLLEQKVIAQKEHDERQMELDIAKAEFQTLANNFKSEGIVFKAPFSGIIKNLPVSDGEFVEEGGALATLTRNRKLLLEGEVSQRYFSQLKNIRSAHFKTPSQDRVYSIEDFNGKVVSYGKVTGQNEHHVPILFEVDNRGDLLAGSFVDLYLLTRPIPNTLVIPKTALMQDYGQFYVYVQTSGESFEKGKSKQALTTVNRCKCCQVLKKASGWSQKGRTRSRWLLCPPRFPHTGILIEPKKAFRAACTMCLSLCHFAR